jgi:hypothetical protein
MLWRFAVLLEGKHTMRSGFSARGAKIGLLYRLTEEIILAIRVHTNNCVIVDDHHADPIHIAHNY